MAYIERDCAEDEEKEIQHRSRVFLNPPLPRDAARRC